MEPTAERHENQKFLEGEINELLRDLALEISPGFASGRSNTASRTLSENYTVTTEADPDIPLEACAVWEFVAERAHFEDDPEAQISLCVTEETQVELTQIPPFAEAALKDIIADEEEFGDAQLRMVERQAYFIDTSIGSIEKLHYCVLYLGEAEIARYDLLTTSGRLSYREATRRRVKGLAALATRLKADRDFAAIMNDGLEELIKNDGLQAHEDEFSDPREYAKEVLIILAKMGVVNFEQLRETAEE